MASAAYAAEELSSFHYELSHDMLVPAGIHVPEEILGSFVLRKYRERGVEFADSQEFDIRLIADYHRYFRSDKIESRAKKHRLLDLAEVAIAEAEEQAADQLESEIRQTEDAAIHGGSILLAVGNTQMENAHAGVMRKTGKPYSTHPFGVGAMMYFAFCQLEEKGTFVDPQKQEAVIYTAFGHDFVEETWVYGKHHHKVKGHYSSLHAVKTFERFRNPYGLNVADGLRFITHLTGMPWLRSWPAYVQERVMQDHLASLIKGGGDIPYNKDIERKPVGVIDGRLKRWKREREYGSWQPKILDAAEERAPDEDKYWIRPFIKELSRITPNMMDDINANLRDFIGLPEEVE